jgi:hypothetical protein
MTDRAADASPRTYARVAGFAYLLVIIIGVLNGAFIDSRLIVPGNDAATANNIMAHDALFRIGTVGILIMYASVVVLSWALYVLLKAVDKNLALLALLIRTGEAILGGATVLLNFVVLQLLSGESYSSVFETEQLQALVGVFLNVRTAGLDIVLLLVGLGGTLFCYLFFTSKYVPRSLAAWGIFTYLSMIVLSVVSILIPNHPVIIEVVLYTLGGLFELIFGFWLMFKGVNVQQWENHVSASPAVQPITEE